MTRTTRRALITATLASLLATPVIAHDTIRHPGTPETPSEARSAKLISGLGTEDAAIRTQDGYVQLSDLSFHYQHRDDPGYQLFEDGSARVVSPDGCYQDSITGRVALRDC